MLSRQHDDERATAVVYVDHNMGTIVKDAFVIDRPIDEVIERYRVIIRTQQPDARLPERMDPADARSRIEDAIENFDALTPTWSQDQWPACRAVIELFVRTLPQEVVAMGTGHPRCRWCYPSRATSSSPASSATA